MAMVKVPPPWRGLLTGLVILPLMVSPIARTYAWIVLLGRNGFANTLLVGSWRIIDAPTTLLFTEGAVFLGLLQLMMPLMMLSAGVGAGEPARRRVGRGGRRWAPTAGRAFTQCGAAADAGRA